jgi:glycerophosphoryl diester phosphodiesterase
MEVRLADALRANGLDSRPRRCFVQCFEVEPLKLCHASRKPAG